MWVQVMGLVMEFYSLQVWGLQWEEEWECRRMMVLEWESGSRSGLA